MEVANQLAEQQKEAAAELASFLNGIKL